MKVALVQDFLFKMGGAERVLKSLADLFPDSPIYTLLYDKEKCGEVFPADRVVTSYLQRSVFRNRPRFLTHKMPQAIESFDFSEFDLVISSNTAFAHGIITPPGTQHLSYCHSPMRYAWDWAHEYLDEQKMGRVKRFLAERLVHKLRIWDRVAADRPDKYLANSTTTASRLRKYYQMDAEVVYPPVDVKRFQISDADSSSRICHPEEEHFVRRREDLAVRGSEEPSGSRRGGAKQGGGLGQTKKPGQDYFLIVSTLSPFKRIDLAVRAFTELQLPLKIVGDGSELARLTKMAGPTVEVLGRKSDAAITDLMQRCRAFVFPGEEDFGIAPVEAMACGKPVIAFGRGGVLESVTNDTGIFFSEPTVESLADGVRKFLNRESGFDSSVIRSRAEEFSEEVFKVKMKKVIDDFMASDY